MSYKNLKGGEEKPLKVFVNYSFRYSNHKSSPRKELTCKIPSEKEALNFNSILNRDQDLLSTGILVVV